MSFSKWLVLSFLVGDFCAASLAFASDFGCDVLEPSGSLVVDTSGIDSMGELVVSPSEGQSERWMQWETAAIQSLAVIGRQPLFIIGEGKRTELSEKKRWMCGSANDCLLQVAGSAGLVAKLLSREGWLVGPKGAVANAIVDVIAFPGQVPDSDDARELFESTNASQLLQPYWSYWGSVPRTHNLIAIVYWRLDEDADDWIVLIRRITEIERESRIVRISGLTAGDPASASCSWVKSRSGFLATGFKEDLDGDGVRDLLWTGLRDHPMQPDRDFVLSGATGELLLEFLGESLLVAEDGEGSPVLGVKFFWQDQKEKEPTSLAILDRKPEREVAGAFAFALVDGSSKSQLNKEITDPREVLVSLKQQKPDAIRPRFYILPGRNPGRPQSGSETVVSHGWDNFESIIMRARRFRAEGPCGQGDCLRVIHQRPLVSSPN